MASQLRRRGSCVHPRGEDFGGGELPTPGVGTYDTDPGHEEQHDCQGQAHAVVAHGVEDGAEFLLAYASEHPTAGALWGERGRLGPCGAPGAEFGAVLLPQGAEQTLRTRLPMPLMAISVSLPHPEGWHLYMSLVFSNGYSQVVDFQHRGPLVTVAVSPGTYTHGFEQMEDDVDRHDPGHQVNDLPGDREEPAVAFRNKHPCARARSWGHSLVAGEDISQHVLCGG